MIDDNNYLISWIVNRDTKTKHSSDWYWVVWIITISLATAFFILGNILLSIIILIGIGILLHNFKNPPEKIIYEISKNGIQVQETIYPWDMLESFYILKKISNQKEKQFIKLLLTSKRLIMPHISIPLNDSIVEEVHQLMTYMLPEIPRDESIIDHIIRMIDT